MDRLAIGVLCRFPGQATQVVLSVPAMCPSGGSGLMITSELPTKSVFSTPGDPIPTTLRMRSRSAALSSDPNQPSIVAAARKAVNRCYHFVLANALGGHPDLCAADARYCRPHRAARPGTPNAARTRALTDHQAAHPAFLNSPRLAVSASLAQRWVALFRGHSGPAKPSCQSDQHCR